MRVLILLIVSGMLLSQPKTDSTTPPTIEIPEAVKPTVEKIVDNTIETKKAEDELSKEMTKQVEIMREIKLKIIQLKKASKVKPTTDKKQPERVINKDALKNTEVKLEYEGNTVHWETRERTWLGRILNSKNILYYPYIIDSVGKKVYLK